MDGLLFGRGPIDCASQKCTRIETMLDTAYCSDCFFRSFRSYKIQWTQMHIGTHIVLIIIKTIFIQINKKNEQFKLQWFGSRWKYVIVMVVLKCSSSHNIVEQSHWKLFCSILGNCSRMKMCNRKIYCVRFKFNRTWAVSTVHAVKRPNRKWNNSLACVLCRISYANQTWLLCSSADVILLLLVALLSVHVSSRVFHFLFPSKQQKKNNK